MHFAHTNVRGRAFVALVLSCLGLIAVLAATPAQALTTNKATARPNQEGGNGVVGGIDTRLTWEGTVGDDEQIEAITLELPQGSSFAGSTTRVTVLDGLTRIPIEGQASDTDERLVVNFDNPVPAGSLLRLEVEGMRFAEAGGDCAVTGTYTASGSQHELDSSDSITVIEGTWLQRAVAVLDANPAVEAWNSNQFLGMFFKPQLILTSLFSLFPGWLVCLVIVICAYPFAITLGLIFALMKISNNVVLRAIAVVYINLLRGTPLFLQIYIMFFGLPMLGINIDNNILGVAVMAINSSAYLAEIFRAGIESIPQGQYEAAASLGMGRLQTMFNIILPQTIRRVIPTVTSDFITSYKDTSLLSSVGVMELMMFAKNATSVSGNITPYVTAAIFYLIVTLPLIKVVGIIEKRMARSERGSGPRPKLTQPTVTTEDAEQVEGAQSVLPNDSTDAGVLMAQAVRAAVGGDING
ncbi:MAG: amino acid ABC transporter permease [Atopobiaceae bacterium]|nr:amino acid ABC transporter permease [Atopobiaceae bacterium]